MRQGLLRSQWFLKSSLSDNEGMPGRSRAGEVAGERDTSEDAEAEG